MNPLVSIIIPCFNAADCVSEAIESALSQTYRNIEVIVIDDGSTDASLEKIAAFGDRIRFETGPNRGGCAARNRGIEIAKGDYIQFLDADDFLVADKIAKHFEALSIDPSGLTVSQGETIDFESQKHLGYIRWAHSNWRRSLVLAPQPTPSPLHRKTDLVSVGGFTVGLKCCQEKDLHLRLAQMGIEFRELPFVGYIVRRKANSVSADSLKSLETRHDVLWRIRNQFERGSEAERTWAPLYSEALAVTGRQLWKSGKKLLALTAFKRAREANFGRIVAHGKFGEKLRVRIAANVGALLSIFIGGNQTIKSSDRSVRRNSGSGQA